MVTARARAWAEGTEFNGLADHDDYDFCTVGAVTYMCVISHVAGPETHPTRGRLGKKTWERAAWEALESLSACTAQLSTVQKVVAFSRKRLAPSGMNAQERERFVFLSERLTARAKALAEEVEQMIAENPPEQTQDS